MTRLVVVAGGADDDPWSLPGFRRSDAPWVSGGTRSLYELSVAAARLGHEVELRGEISGHDLDEVARCGGGAPAVGMGPRRPDADDLVVVPEGDASATSFLRVAMSPARAVIYLLAPPNLFGPGILPGFVERSPLEVDPGSVSRPEHHRALRELGFELWTNSPAVAADAEAAGVECAFTGTGQPIPFPEPRERTHDVAVVTDNRWASLSRDVARRIRGSVLEIPRIRRAELLETLASARILVHPAVVEGQGRLQIEARAVGTVPVSLRSNRFVAGQEEGGGMLVDSLDDMVSEVERLLARPDELAERSARCRDGALEQVDWERFVRRVDELLSAPPPADDLRPLRARAGEAIQASMEELRERARQVAGLERAVSWLEGLLRAADDERAALREEVEWIRSVAAAAELRGQEAGREAAAYRGRRVVRLADRLARLFGPRR